MRRPARGFTLLELMMVVAVTGILVMIALPSYQSYLYRAKAAEVVLVLDKIRTVLAGLQSERGATLGTELKVTTGGWEVHSFLASQGQGSMSKVAELGQAELSHPRLGVEVAVNSGWYNNNQPGQYKVSLSWVPSGPGREALAASSRQVALAVAQIMKPHAYLVTTGSTETSLYFRLPEMGASQGGTTPPQPPVVTPPVTKPPVVTPPVVTPPVVTPPVVTPPVVTPPVVTPPVVRPPVVTPPQPQVAKPPQQYDPGWYMNPSTTTPPPHARPPVSVTPSDPGWYMDPPKPTQQPATTGRPSDPGWYMDPPKPTQQPATTGRPSDPGWYMDPPKTQQPKDPGWYMDPPKTQAADPLWYMDPINRNWGTTP